MLPVLARFNGQPQVDAGGNIVYAFPDLQQTAGPTVRCPDWLAAGPRVGAGAAAPAVSWQRFHGLQQMVGGTVRCASWLDARNRLEVHAAPPAAPHRPCPPAPHPRAQGWLGRGQQQRGGLPSAPALEQRWQLTAASAGQKLGVIALGAFNLVGVSCDWFVSSVCSRDLGRFIGWPGVVGSAGEGAGPGAGRERAPRPACHS